jgi:hypothetical protein
MACFGGGQSEIVPIMEDEEADEPLPPATPGGSAESELGYTASEDASDAGTTAGGAPPPVFLPPPAEVRVRPPLQASAAATAAREREREKQAQQQQRAGGSKQQQAVGQPRFCMPATLQDFWGELGAVFDPRRRRCF